jgi:N-acetylglutamate synthase
VTPTTNGLWVVFAEHLARLFGEAPRLRVAGDRHWWAVLTCEPHIDLNQLGLLDGARVEDAEQVVALVADADVPVVMSVASHTANSVTEPFVGAGLVSAPLPEPLMWLGEPPRAVDSEFDVRRVVSDSDLEAAYRLCAEAHSIDGSLVRRVMRRDLAQAEVSTWIAWDAGDPISVAWLTPGSHIGVWEMMTPPQHRRRGAARAVLTTALGRSWTPQTAGAFLWASPAGRPLYESLGFQAVDEATIWYTAGHEDAAAAVGQAPAL